MNLTAVWCPTALGRPCVYVPLMAAAMKMAMMSTPRAGMLTSSNKTAVINTCSSQTAANTKTQEWAGTMQKM